MTEVNLNTEPAWVQAFVQEVHEKFDQLVGRINAISALKFELDSCRHLSEEEKKPLKVEQPERECTYWPERQATLTTFEWNYPKPPKNKTFNEPLFKKHVIDKINKLKEKTNCYMVLRLTIIGTDKLSESCLFKLSDCEFSHVSNLEKIADQ